ncbi:MAG: hypothetical protein AAGE52_27315 [Myxococcota bacterium]
MRYLCHVGLLALVFTLGCSAPLRHVSQATIAENLDALRTEGQVHIPATNDELVSLALNQRGLSLGDSTTETQISALIEGCSLRREEGEQPGALAVRLAGEPCSLRDVTFVSLGKEPRERNRPLAVGLGLVAVLVLSAVGLFFRFRPD